jgi:NADPH-dependent curcumin reductase CurA
MPTPATHRQWLINDRPLGRPLQDGDFKLVESPVRAPGPGEVLLKTRYLGFDPAQKGWMENIGGYVAPTEIGEVMRGSGLGEVIESNHPRYKPGDLVAGMLCWQEYPTISGDGLEKIKDAELATAYLGALGTTGMTAYFGFIRVGKPQPGDTVVVSGAAGATGSMVGQIARIMGCRVIGIAGGAEKCAWIVNECGYDAAIDYKSENVRDRLNELCPGGIDVVFDNVGGSILDDMLSRIAMHARVVICGGISRYTVGKMPAGPQNYFNLIFMRATMAGFIVLDWMSEYPLARRRMTQWIREDRIRFKEDIQQGFENTPRTLMRLFQGENFGKQLLKVA